MNHFYIACVVYNRRVQDITSLKQFISLAEKHEDVQILLYDNSTDHAVIKYNAEWTGKPFVTYTNNCGNIGLSKAYNKVLHITSESDWIFWADDDTMFSDRYMENVYRAAKEEKYSVISGIVHTSVNTVLSPIYRNKKVKKKIVSEKTYSDVYCINSGLCIRRSVYDMIGLYDERLFIDMIDYWLFDELRKYDMDCVYVTDGAVVQNFSGNEAASFQKLFGRFKIYSRDFNKYCNIEQKGIIYRIRILVKRFINILRMSFLKG